MSREQWRALRLSGGLLIVVAAALATLAGAVWVPPAAAVVFAVFALVREPPQGAREWLPLLGLALAGAAVAVALTAGAR